MPCGLSVAQGFRAAPALIRGAHVPRVAPPGFALEWRSGLRYMSWWACGAQQRVALSHYHVGGAAFVPVLGDAHHGVVDKVEVVVTLRESIMLFCGQCPNHVLRASSVNMHDCGQNMCAMQLRLRALHCAVAHAVNAAGVKHEVATISVDDIERNSILPYATAHKHTGKGDVTSR